MFRAATIGVTVIQQLQCNARIEYSNESRKFFREIILKSYKNTTSLNVMVVCIWRNILIRDFIVPIHWGLGYHVKLTGGLPPKELCRLEQIGIGL